MSHPLYRACITGLIGFSVLTGTAFATDNAKTAKSAKSQETPAQAAPLEQDPAKTQALFGIGVLGFSLGTYSQCDTAKKPFLADFEKELIRASAIEAPALGVTSADIKAVYVKSVEKGRQAKPAPSKEDCADLQTHLNTVLGNMKYVK